jgi:hypothetical protein
VLVVVSSWFERRATRPAALSKGLRVSEEGQRHDVLHDARAFVPMLLTIVSSRRDRVFDSRRRRHSRGPRQGLTPHHPIWTEHAGQ